MGAVECGAWVRRAVCVLCAALGAGAAGAGEPAAADAPRRTLALSFDDAPRPDSAVLSGAERARRLLAGLAAARTGPVVFFAIANSERLSGEGSERLRAYAAAGHRIANHSAAHRSLREFPAQAFLEDVAQADRALRGVPGFRAWFRFPFLDEGETEAVRDRVRTGLDALGYRQGYVTIDTYDWYLDRLARDAAARGAALDRQALGALYVQMITASAEFYDRLALDTLGRSPHHVLLLHENDLAALFIGELVAALRADGWALVDPETAYADPIAARAPQTLFLNQGRVAALAHAAGRAPAELIGPYEEESELAALFAARVLQATH